MQRGSKHSKIVLHRHSVSAVINQRYALINELRFELTIDADAFISNFITFSDAFIFSALNIFRNFYRNLRSSQRLFRMSSKSNLSYVFFILILSSIHHHSVQSISNYIIDAESDVPMPLDTCMVRDSNSIMYSCLNYTDLIFKHTFTNDIYCLSSPVITPLYDLPSSQFNCIGESNYVLEEYYQSEEDCNIAAYYYLNTTKTIHIASDVCFYDHTQKQYAKYSCTALFTQIAYFNDYNTCNDYYNEAVSNTSTSSSNISFIEYSSPTLCSHHSNIPDFPYHSLSECVVNDIPETLYSSSYVVDAYTLSMYHRIGLIDFYISTTDYGDHLWDKNCTDDYYDGSVGISEWNLFAIAIYGDLYTDTLYCGLYTYTFYDPTEYIIIATGNADLTGTIPSTLCYLQERLTSLRIVSAPHLYGTIPECIAIYHVYMDYLLIAGTSITGPIPSDIGNLAYIEDIWFANNPFMNATIPDSICTMMTNPWFANIVFSNVSVYGRIPECLLSENYTHDANLKIFTLEQTKINDSISEAWCNISDAHYLILQLIDNPYITGNIPGCLTPYSLEIREMNGLTGTVPGALFCREILASIIFENNTGFDPSTVPSCLSDDKPYLSGLILYNSSFIGTFPILPMNSSLIWINIAANTFEGSLTEIVDFGIDDVSYFMAHKNKFHDDDISSLLSYFWEETNVSTLSISDNRDIHGTMPDDIYNTELSIFLAHNCDLHGTLPQRSTFEALTTVTLHGNRLSGKLPMNIYPAFNTSSSIVLLDNLFSTSETDDLPDWINSPFSTAPNLYISRNRYRMGIFVITMCYLGIFILFAHMIYRIIKKRNKTTNQKEDTSKDEFGFYANIEFILSKIGDWKLLCFTIVLMIFYVFTANYYHTVTTESLFTLSWYHATDKWLDWMLLVLALLLEMILTRMVLILHLEQISDKHSKTLKQIDIATEQQQRKSQQIDIYRQYSQKVIDCREHKVTESLDTTNIASMYHMNMNQTIRMRYMYASRILLIIVYFILYLLGIVLVIIYLIARTLPEQNVLNLDASESILITQSIGLIMFINNRFIIKGIVNTIAKINDFVYFYRAEFTLFLRMNNTIIIPLIASIFLLNDCGKYWIHLWDYCNDDDLRSQFDFIADLAPAELKSSCIQACDTNWQLLSSNEVCSNPSISSMDANKCIRSFFYHWTFAIIMKIIFTMLAQLFGLCYRVFNRKNKNKLYIEGYYTAMLTSLVVSISFLFVAPLILPLNILQIALRTELYRLMVNKFGMKLSTINTRDVKSHKTKESIPIYFLWFGVLIGQTLVILFLRCCVYSISISVIFMLSISAMDIYCGAVIKINKMKFKGAKEEHAEKVRKESKVTLSSNRMYSPSVSPDSKRNIVRSTTTSPLSDVVADVGDGEHVSAFSFKLNADDDMIIEEPVLEEGLSHTQLSIKATQDSSELVFDDKGDQEYINTLHKTIEAMQREMKKMKQDMKQIKLQNNKEEIAKKEKALADDIQHKCLSLEINGKEDVEEGQ